LRRGSFVALDVHSLDLLSLVVEGQEIDPSPGLPGGHGSEPGGSIGEPAQRESVG